MQKVSILTILSDTTFAKPFLRQKDQYGKNKK